MVEKVELKHRLAVRLARYTVVFAFCIGLLLSSLQVVGDYQNQEDSIDQIIAQILVVSGPPATRAVNTLDSTLAEEVVNGLLQYPFITSAQIKDELGKSLAHSNSRIAPSETLWLTEKITTESKLYDMELKTPDYVGVGPGYLVLQVNMDQALQPFYDRAKIIIFSGVARNILLALVLMALFYFVLTRPLELLAEQFIAIAKQPEDGQQLKVAKSHQNNELGRLGVAGNQFVNTVQSLLEDKNLSSEALKKSEMRLLRLIDQLPQMVAAQNADGDILFANQQYSNFYGHSIKSIRDFKLSDHKVAALEITHLDTIRSKTLASKAVTFINELELTNHAGKKVSFSVQVAPFEYFNEPATLFVANDISGQIKVQAHIAHLANHDSLTGLPNRTLLNEKINDALNVSLNEDELHAMLFLDLDHFKNINDAQGHSVGDEVLRKVGYNLRSIVRQVDTVARLGGDEFVVLITKLSNDKTLACNYVTNVCDKIIESMTHPVIVDDRRLHLGVSIGIVLFPIGDETKDDLLRYADTAMYKAKEKGRNQAVFYHPSMSEAVEKRQELELELSDALEHNQFEVYYQPQVSAEGKIYGLEALIRWHHPTRGMVSPQHFIPVLESGGLILPISEWVIRQSCEQVAKWKANGFWQDDWHIAINVSPTQFYQDSFVKLLQLCVAKSGIEFKHLCVEVTETVAIDNIEFTAKRLDAIRRLGMLVALDDFGTGYSSMSYLKDLPIDILKLDRTFIRRLDSNPKDRLVTQAITDIAVILNLTVMAEGIESKQQVGMATDVGCHYFQGYYFSKPLPANDLQQMYEETEHF